VSSSTTPVLPRITFYVPCAALTARLPSKSTEYWSWINDAIRPLENDRGTHLWLGPYNWTLQSFIHLREAGLDCHLSADLPDSGVIVTHTDFLPPGLLPRRDQFFVALKPDRSLQQRFAQFVVVQNSYDPVRAGIWRALIDSEHIQYWPQPGLRHRDGSRGDAFENICFMGNRRNFIGAAEDLAYELGTLGLKWMMPERREWHDYRAMDAVVAVRPGADHAGVAHMDPDRKPASKLYNAWLAGVPAVLSPDVAFRQLRRSELDFIEARDIHDIVCALRRLRVDRDLRRRMVENGRTRATEFTAVRIAATWLSLFEERIVPAYKEWVSSRRRRSWFHISRRLLHWFGGST